jgi:hypothetical protein
MKKSTLRLLAEAEALSKMVSDPNVSTEQVHAAFDAWLSSGSISFKTRAPKKKVRRGVGSY